MINQEHEPTEQEKERIDDQRILFDKLEVARIKAGMTIKDIAKKLNVSTSVYCDYRNTCKLMTNEEVEWFQVGFELINLINSTNRKYKD